MHERLCMAMLCNVVEVVHRCQTLFMQCCHNVAKRYSMWCNVVTKLCAVVSKMCNVSIFTTLPLITLCNDVLHCTTYGNVVPSLENFGQPLCNVVTTLQKSCPTSSPMRVAVPCHSCIIQLGSYTEIRQLFKAVGERSEIPPQERQGITCFACLIWW